MPDLLTIENAGQAILSTNYWDSEYARKGYFFLTINAGAFRLLVPPPPVPDLDLSDMLAASEVIVSRGPWPAEHKRDALEILFEDYSDHPLALHFGPEQVDRMPAEADRNKSFVFAIWTKTGKAKEMLARYRKVARLPWLKPWRATQ